MKILAPEVKRIAVNSFSCGSILAPEVVDQVKIAIFGTIQQRICSGSRPIAAD
jgi:hypothetical protein